MRKFPNQQNHVLDWRGFNRSNNCVADLPRSQKHLFHRQQQLRKTHDRLFQCYSQHWGWRLFTLNASGIYFNQCKSLSTLFVSLKKAYI